MSRAAGYGVLLLGVCLSALTHCAAAVDPTLLLWLPFDEGSGALASDRSAQGLEADLANVQWAVGAFGTAARFGGTNASVIMKAV